LGHLITHVGDDLLVHPAADLDRAYQGAEVVVGQDHAGGLLGDLAAAAHGDADVRLLQGRRVVHGVSGHGDDLAVLLHHPGQAQLVLRRHPAEDMQLGQPPSEFHIGQLA
jgi:hypothetical protein